MTDGKYKRECIPSGVWLLLRVSQTLIPVKGKYYHFDYKIKHADKHVVYGYWFKSNHYVPKCLCGCGELVNIGTIYITGHNLQGLDRVSIGLKAYETNKKNGLFERNGKRIKGNKNPMKNPEIAKKCTARGKKTRRDNPDITRRRVETQRKNGLFERNSKRVKADNPMHDEDTVDKCFNTFAKNFFYKKHGYELVSKYKTPSAKRRPKVIIEPIKEIEPEVKIQPTLEPFKIFFNPNTALHKKKKRIKRKRTKRMSPEKMRNSILNYLTIRSGWQKTKPLYNNVYDEQFKINNLIEHRNYYTVFNKCLKFLSEQELIECQMEGNKIKFVRLKRS